MLPIKMQLPYAAIFSLVLLVVLFEAAAPLLSAAGTESPAVAVAWVAEADTALFNCYFLTRF